MMMLPPVWCRSFKLIFSSGRGWSLVAGAWCRLQRLAAEAGFAIDFQKARAR